MKDKATWVTCRRCGRRTLATITYNGTSICVTCYNELKGGGGLAPARPVAHE